MLVSVWQAIPQGKGLYWQMPLHHMHQVLVCPPSGESSAVKVYVHQLPQEYMWRVGTGRHWQPCVPNWVKGWEGAKS